MDNLPFAQSRHGDDRGAARRRVICLAGLLVVASAAVCLPGCDPGGIEAPAAGQAASANVVVNGDFDQGMSGGAPAGWALEDDLASRGTMRVERRGQRASVLRLSPNRNNTDKDRTYAIGQSVDVGRLRGRTVTFSALLGGSGGAVPVALAMAVSSDGRMLQAASLTSRSDSLSSERGVLQVPSGTAQIIVAAAVTGTSGDAWFDDLRLEIGDVPSSSEVPSATPLSGELIKNGGFEDIAEDGLPRDWSLEDNLRGKGTARSETGGVKGRALHLVPNSRNNNSDEPFAVGQIVPVRALREQWLDLRGSLRSRNGAAGIVLVLPITTAFKTVGSPATLVAPSGSNDWSQQTARVQVPADADQLIVGAAVNGTRGEAWFDDLSLTVASRVAADPGGASGELAASVVVDAAALGKAVHRELFGANIEWFRNANGIWDEERKQLRPDIIKLARDLRLGPVRFPSGAQPDFYHWRDAVGRGPRRLRSHVTDDDSSRDVVGTDELVQFCRLTGAEPMLQANIVTGTPEEAADWVAYCNRPNHSERVRNGFSAPHNVRFWELGNEQYLAEDSEVNRKSELSADEYTRRVLRFSKAMKQEDPSILIGAVGGVNFGRYRIVRDERWTETLLRGAHGAMDFLAVHNAYAPLTALGTAPFDDVYRALLAFPRLVAANLRDIDSLITKVAGDHNRRIKLAITEWGPFFHMLPTDPWVGHAKTLGSALYVASVMQVFLTAPRVEIANYFKLTEASFMGLINADGQPKAPYFALQLYSKYFGDRVVDTRVDASSYDSVQVGGVEAVRGVPYVDALASVSDDGSRLFLVAVNKHFTQPARLTIRLNGFTPEHGGVVRVLTGPSLDAHNGDDLPRDIPGLTWAKQIGAPRSPMIEEGRPGLVATRESPLTGVDATFTYVCPPMSANALELRRKAAP